MQINPLHAIDFYKVSHKDQYPEGTELVYSNFTPRSSKLSNLPEGYRDGIVFFGLQYFIYDHLINDWNDNFFNKPKEEVVQNYARRLRNALGTEPDVSHIESLHDLGYLPLEIRSLNEGSYVPIGVPVLTIKNTIPEFFWLTNYLESVMSDVLWKPCTSATTARYYRKLCEDYANQTCDNYDHLPFQCHDFSFRGMSGIVDGALSGAGHLLSFSGTDTVLSIDLLEDYYYADSDHQLVGASVPATEHSVMCMGGKEDEIETFRRLIEDIYPTGIVSIVSDTWDFWKVIGEYLPALKDKVMARDGKVVIRPDSGDPVDIICGSRGHYVGHGLGDAQYIPTEKGSLEHKGAIEALWDTFGGTINSKGYKVLDPHIGLIYGDSITPERAKTILKKLEAKGFASSNVVFGVGSYTYTYVTRDTYGFAVKATAGIVNGEVRQIFKDPATDSGKTKKSLKGFLGVYFDEDNGLYVVDNLDEEPYDDELKVRFTNGALYNETSLQEIRNRVSNSL